MWNTFKCTLLTTLREKSVVFWTIAFPLLLGTLFFAMFSNIDEANDFDPIPVAIVENDALHDKQSFIEVIKAVSETGENRLLEPVYVKTSDEATLLLKNSEVVGFYSVGENSELRLTVSSESDVSGSNIIYQTILRNLLNTYLHKQATVETLVEQNPSALSDGALLESLFEQKSYTDEISLTANKASGTVRYFYALLGFSSIMSALIGMITVVRTQANLSPIGARRAMGSVSRIRVLSATLSAAWLMSFASLLIAYCYLHFILGINLGDYLFCILAILVASLMTTGLGVFIGSIPKIGEGSKSGILTGLSCFLSLFAGLYGEPVMALADAVARNAPVAQLLNPARQVTELFYSLYYYDDYERFFVVALTLLAISCAFFIGATVFMRRQRYANL
ncbi:MAG TPA: ABC transporter permease [Coriobacteriia bacterium]|nr:ABC transporter permease [Coriobacteriia bacterium]